MESILLKLPDGSFRLKVRGRGRARPVCTVKQACARLGRTRRQVYRYVRSGDVPSMGKMFGEHLLDQRAVERLQRAPMSRQPLPRRLQRLFPDYRIADLNAGRDRTLVISRVLDEGGVADVRWLLRRFSRGDVIAFLESDGARLLSPRSGRLWRLFFGLRAEAPPSWRDRGPWAGRQG